MITLNYKTSDEGVTHEHTVTFDGGQTWGDILEQFFHFLNTAGFVIDQTAIGEMVEVAVDAHDRHLNVKYGNPLYREEECTND